MVESNNSSNVQENKIGIKVELSDPIKIGSGFFAYMVYEVNVSKPDGSKFNIQRRFRDFFTMYEYLHEKYSPKGYLLPTPPEKSLSAMTKVKISKEDSETVDSLMERKVGLHRFLYRILIHPVVGNDDYIVKFLTNSDFGTESSGGFNKLLKMAKNINNTVTKMMASMECDDPWFTDQENLLESQESAMVDILSACQVIIEGRKATTNSLSLLSVALQAVAVVEPNHYLSSAFKVLSETEAQFSSLNLEQLKEEIIDISESFKDYINYIHVCKNSFSERNKSWQSWQLVISQLNEKKDAFLRAEMSGRAERIASAKKEVEEFDNKAKQCEEDYYSITKVIKEEVKRFSIQRDNDLKLALVNFFKSLYHFHEKSLEYWTSLIPTFQSIA